MGPGASTIEAQIGEAAHGWRLDRALAQAVPTLSRERLKVLIAAGNVVDPRGVPVRNPSQKASAGTIFSVSIPEPEPAHNAAQAIALNVVYEDEHLLVIDKPAGLVVHPAAGNPDGTLVNALLHHCAGQLSGIGGVARPGIVHRIDKDTSGLIVAAKHDRAHEGLARQFKAHSIDRRYRAIVAGVPMQSEGVIEAPLGRSPANRKKMAIVPGGKHATTRYRLIQPLKEAALIECRLETGRTHQVRVHMASIGHPLLGDPVYGRPRTVHRSTLETLSFRRQALHAAHLGFTHPIDSRNLAFDSEIPADMGELFKHLHV
ncbi:RluA family pseudouridine synthase [Stakelama sediminis]|uniref:Pseudouridine synthase n=1 Tax=Stakelama sediminis TaxID=463200 RepID=A0A840YUC5_9SPHN|nr:RluA family pseudouridine synthase [Stakelama sediminis]MBB5717154.1 23S rRNA pseudouridine1911/1915/1917 synthase [Stakelama sediminis]